MHWPGGGNFIRYIVSMGSSAESHDWLDTSTDTTSYQYTIIPPLIDATYIWLDTYYDVCCIEETEESKVNSYPIMHNFTPKNIKIPKNVNMKSYNLYKRKIMPHNIRDFRN